MSVVHALARLLDASYLDGPPTDSQREAWRDAVAAARREHDRHVATLREIASWQDCPPCPECALPCGTVVAALDRALADTAAAEAHDREVRARVWEEADALLDAEGPGRVYHERLLRARAAKERGR